MVSQWMQMHYQMKLRVRFTLGTTSIKSLLNGSRGRVQVHVTSEIQMCLPGHVYTSHTKKSHASEEAEPCL